MLWVSAATELTRAKVLSVSSWWKCPPVGCRRIHLRWLRCLWRRRGLAGLVTATRPHWCGGRGADWWAWLRCPWAVAGPGRGIELTRRSVTRPHWCGGCRRDRRAWPRCRWVAAGQGGPRDRPLRAFRLACGDLAGGPPPTGTHSGRAPQSSPARQGSQTKTSGTGRCHDPRLGWQGTQSCNPERIRNVGGATRPGHSQGRPDKRNDVLGGPAQAS